MRNASGPGWLLDGPRLPARLSSTQDGLGLWREQEAVRRRRPFWESRFPGTRLTPFHSGAPCELEGIVPLRDSADRPCPAGGDRR